MNRRRCVGLLLGAAISARFVPRLASAEGEDPSRDGSKLDQLYRFADPFLDLVHATTGESLTTRFFTAAGYDLGEIAKINWFLRDWRAGSETIYDVRVLWALAVLRHAAMEDGHSGRVRVTSGYRTATTNTNTEGAAHNSMHLVGRAVDFGLPGIEPAVVADFAEWLQVGGVGRYRAHTHLDSGHLRSWTG